MKVVFQVKNMWGPNYAFVFQEEVMTIVLSYQNPIQVGNHFKLLGVYHA